MQTASTIVGREMKQTEEFDGLLERVAEGDASVKELRLTNSSIVKAGAHFWTHISPACAAFVFYITKTAYLPAKITYTCGNDVAMWLQNAF